MSGLIQKDVNRRIQEAIRGWSEKGVLFNNNQRTIAVAVPLEIDFAARKFEELSQKIQPDYTIREEYIDPNFFKFAAVSTALYDPKINSLWSEEIYVNAHLSPDSGEKGPSCFGVAEFKLSLVKYPKNALEKVKNELGLRFPSFPGYPYAEKTYVLGESSYLFGYPSDMSVAHVADRLKNDLRIALSARKMSV